MTNDPDIIEAAARALLHCELYPTLSEAARVVAAITPLIRAAALEEAAQVAEDYGKRWTFVPAVIEVEAIAAAIRALKEQP